MNSSICPQCKNEVNESISRLIQDTCGHRKCRLCLLKEDSGCKICLKNVTSPSEKANCNISVIKSAPAEITIKDKYVQNIDVENCSENKTETVDNFETHKNVPHIIILTKSPFLYKCTVCSKTFSTTASVRYHSYCGGNEKPLRCEICEKTFISRSHLETHKLKHSGVRSFKCSHCQKSFMQKSKLNRHTKLHTGVRPFVCMECGKSFTNKDALNGHIRTHNGDKPFSCKHCGHKFNNRSNLSKHITTHSRDKPYMCEECGKKFGNKWTLASHRKCHTTERPHACQRCSKTFTNIKDLRRHSLIHLDVKQYGCNICNMKFCRKDNLERHLKNTHSIKDYKKLKSASVKIIIEKDIINSMTSNKTRTDPEMIVKSASIVEEQALKENPNAIHVIKVNESQIDSNLVDSRPSISNAVPVINGPFKLAFKPETFKNNYNILNKTYSTEPPPRIQTKKHDMVESLNICQKIFNPSSDFPIRYENPTDVKTSPMNTPKNVIMSVGKVNEKDSLEICKKIFAPNDSTPFHYETSFEHKKHADIKNIKFKLPSTYTNNAIKVHSELEWNNVEKMTSIQVSENEESDTKDYVELQPVTLCADSIELLNHCKKSVIVHPISLEAVPKESFSDLHWRRRTSQNLQPRESSSL